MYTPSDVWKTGHACHPTAPTRQSAPATAKRALFNHSTLVKEGKAGFTRGAVVIGVGEQDWAQCRTTRKSRNLSQGSGEGQWIENH